jgi:hypothetical protein
VKQWDPLHVWLAASVSTNFISQPLKFRSWEKGGVSNVSDTERLSFVTENWALGFDATNVDTTGMISPFPVL